MKIQYKTGLRKLKNVPKDSLVEVFIDTIRFDNNSASIKPTEYSKIHYIYELSTKYPQYQIKLIGHEQKNKTVHRSIILSARRAEKVREFYIEHYELPEDKIYWHYNDSSNICKCVEVYFNNQPRVDGFPRL